MFVCEYKKSLSNPHLIPFQLTPLSPQGDTETELGLPNSPLCNRAETLVPESQVGFIDFIIVPSMNLLGDMFDSLLQALHNETNGQKTVGIGGGTPNPP